MTGFSARVLQELSQLEETKVAPRAPLPPARLSSQKRLILSLFERMPDYEASPLTGVHWLAMLTAFDWVGRWAEKQCRQE
jgi:hypothetical protein